MSGASPRLRGKQVFRRKGRVVERCIPAPAGETLVRPRSCRRPGVHPRACGGNGPERHRQRGPVGASPRLRGKPPSASPSAYPSRCIPAPAGETSRCAWARCRCTVHPRACGGNWAWWAPPRRFVRCIPAPAGETTWYSIRASRSPVHPRACGGNFLAGSNRVRGQGASPRLRGKRP